MHGLGHLLKAADAVASGKEAGDISSAIGVHFDEAAISLGAQLARHVGAIGSAQRDKETVHC